MWKYVIPGGVKQMRRQREADQLRDVRDLFRQERDPQTADERVVEKKFRGSRRKDAGG